MRCSTLARHVLEQALPYTPQPPRSAFCWLLGAIRRNAPIKKKEICGKCDPSSGGNALACTWWLVYASLLLKATAPNARSMPA